jgi:hypothetical protein
MIQNKIYRGVFLVFAMLILTSCGSIVKIQTKESRYNDTLMPLLKECNKGLGNARSCYVLGNALRRPPAGVYPNIAAAKAAYQYAAFAAKRDCSRNNGDACLVLGGFYREGKGGLPKNRKLAYKYHKKACSIPATKNSNFCRNIDKAYPEYRKRRNDTDKYFNKYLDVVRDSAQGRTIGMMTIGKYGRNRQGAYNWIKKNCGGNRTCMKAAVAKYNAYYN